MAKIKFITDSASDISETYEKKYDILIMNFKVAMGDKSYTSRVDFDNNKFYKMLDAYDGVKGVDLQLVWNRGFAPVERAGSAVGNLSSWAAEVC